MHLPLKILLVERRQPEGCLKRALRGNFALNFQWRRVASESELRAVAREYAPTVVLSADEMQGRSHQEIERLLCMLSVRPPEVMICEIGDGGAPWLCDAPGLYDAPLEPPVLRDAVALETKVRAVQQGLLGIFHSSVDAVVLLDADGWISELNDHAQRLLGAAACERRDSKLHVHQLIGGLQGAGEGGCLSLPLVAVNLDGLPMLNEVHGPHGGDAVIDLIASVVQPQFARCGLLARLGSNQYLALLPHLSPPADAAVAVRGARQMPVDSEANDADINETTIFTTIPTLGIDAPTATQLCGRSDALQRYALSVHFQPQFDLLSGRACGVEALARWTLTNGRTLPPDLFIPVAERMGTIGALDAWVLEQACTTACAWRGRDAERLTLSVNVSNRHIGVDYMRSLPSLLASTGFPARRLEVEIEEGLIIGNDPSIHQCLLRWKELGVRIAVNHRSADYSSLGYLSSISVDRLKLDKSLIHGMAHLRGTAAMVQAVVALGAELHIDVIAEGVETHSQLEMLKRIGCRHAQGYLLARPMPAVQAQIALRKPWGNLTRDLPQVGTAH